MTGHERRLPLTAARPVRVHDATHERAARLMHRCAALRATLRATLGAAVAAAAAATLGAAAADDLNVGQACSRHALPDVAARVGCRARLGVGGGRGGVARAPRRAVVALDLEGSWKVHRRSRKVHGRFTEGHRRFMEGSVVALYLQRVEHEQPKRPRDVRALERDLPLGGHEGVIGESSGRHQRPRDAGAPERGPAARGERVRLHGRFTEGSWRIHGRFMDGRRTCRARGARASAPPVSSTLARASRTDGSSSRRRSFPERSIDASAARTCGIGVGRRSGRHRGVVRTWSAPRAPAASARTAPP